MLLELAGRAPAQLFIGRRQLDQAQVLDVALIMADRPFAQPLPQPALEKAVGEILAPQRAVTNARFGHRTVQIQHPHQAWPGPAPIGHRENRSPMREQAGQQVMAILPNALGHDQRRRWVQLAEYLDAHFLRINKTMFLLRVERVSPDALPAFGLQSPAKDRFHSGLFRPAFLVGRQAKIAIGHQIDVLGFEPCSRFHTRRGHGISRPGPLRHLNFAEFY